MRWASLRRWLRGALVGAGVGLLLTIEEMVTARACGESPALGLWAVAGFAYVAVFTLMGWGLAAALSGQPGIATGFAYVGGVGVALRGLPLLQEFLPARPPAAFFGLGAAALVSVFLMLLGLKRMTRDSGRRAVVLVFGAGCALATAFGGWSALRSSLARPPLGRLVAGLGLPFLLLALALGGLHLSTPIQRRSVLVVVGVVAVLSNTRPWLRSERSDGFLRDELQPRAVAGTSRDRPNIVLIVLDALRARSLSCYGNPRRTSPALDNFAARAVRYSNCIAPAPWTLPAHAALFTGLLFTSTHPGNPEHAALPEGVDTLAEVLARNGYATAGFASNFVILGGRYQLEQGFRYFEGRAAAGFRRLSEPTLQQRLPLRTPLDLIEPLVRGLPPFYLAEEVTARARWWITSRRPAGQPYCLFLNYLDAHIAIRHRWGGGLLGRGVSTPVELLENRRPPTLSERLVLTSTYDQAVAYLDQQVGDLLHFVEQQKDADDTWIIVTADHGDALGEHGRVGHNPDDLYQEILHVPLIIRYPRTRAEERGAVEARPVELVDVFPTILARLNLSSPVPLEGRPLQGPERDATFAEGFGADAVLAGGLKFVEQRAGEARLFDLQDDPGELRNLVTERAAAAAALHERLRGWRIARRRVLSGGRVPSQIELLRSLGYVR